MRGYLKGLTGLATWRVPGAWIGEDGVCDVDAASFLLRGFNEACAPPQGGAMYTMLLRTFTAYDLYTGGELVPGTFLRALALLPALREMGVSIIMLLPVFDHSRLHQKGDWGSPYAIRDLLSFDDEQREPLVDAPLSDQFAAFADGCKRQGIKLMLDFVFRTAARDSVLIADHPDWFYWIDKAAEAGFKAPGSARLPKLCPLSDAAVQILHASPEAEEYRAQFRYDPRKLDAKLFEQVKAMPGNLLLNIENAFGITTAPAYSDVINDPQPMWSDVTFFRMDMSDDGSPPCFMQDSIKLDRYPAQAPNTELEDYIASVIPYYIKSYDIDGARVDMAHALPVGLNSRIVESARELKSGFNFWSEELTVANAGKAKQAGYDFISGDLWSKLECARSPYFGKRIVSTCMNAALPIVGALETPDTPRALQQFSGDVRRNFSLALISMLLPNTIPTINMGQELCEVQPMNLGLGEEAKGRFALPTGDDMHGRLAFFDPYRLHWDGANIREAFKLGLALRQRFSSLFSGACRMRTHKFLLAIHYSAGDSGLIVLMNTSPTRTLRLKPVEVSLPGKLGSTPIETVYSTCGTKARVSPDKRLALMPGAIFIGAVNR